MKKILEKYGFKKKKGIYYRIHNKEVFQVIGVVKISGLWFLKYDFAFLHTDELDDTFLNFLIDGLVEFDIDALLEKEEKYFYYKDDAWKHLSEEHLIKISELIDINKYLEFCNKQIIKANGRANSLSIDDYLYLKKYDIAEEMLLNEIKEEDECIASHVVLPFTDNSEEKSIFCELIKLRVEEQKILLEKIKTKYDFSKKYEEIYQRNLQFLEKKL